MVELVNNIENLEFIISKAREYDVQVPAVDENSGSNASDDGDIDILDASIGNPTRKELVAAIRSLNEDERVELLALVCWTRRLQCRRMGRSALDRKRPPQWTRSQISARHSTAG